MNKVKIGFNEGLKRTTEQKGRAKIIALENAVKLAEDAGISVVKKEFVKGFKQYIEKELRKKYKDFVGISLKKLFEFTEIDDALLNRFWIEYSTNPVELTKDFTEVKTIDYNIYTTSEDEVIRFNASMKAIDTIHEIEVIQGGKLSRNDLAKFLPCIDPINPHDLQPNISWIKGYNLR